MSSKLTLAGVLALSIAATWLAFGGKSPAEAPQAGAVAAPAAPDVAPRARGSVSTRSAVEDAPVELQRSEFVAAASKPAKSGPSSAFTVVGSALDQHGAGLAGVELRVVPGNERAWSDRVGQFRVDVSAEAGSVQVVSENLVEVRRGAWRRRSDRPAVLILAPRIRVAGVVRDERGAAIDGARVALLAPLGFESRFSVELVGSSEIAWSTSSDARGAFALPTAPALAGGELRVTAVGFEPLTLASPLNDEHALNLGLRRNVAAPEALLRGRVVRADGWPAADALVSFDENATKTDREGEFSFELSSDSKARRITAVAAGQLPASYEFDAAPQRGAPPAFVELRLGGATLEIEGRVVDEHGAPRVGGRVCVLDGERFGVLGAVPLQLEALLAGGAVPAQAIDSLSEAQAGRDYHSARPQSSPDAIVSWATTDDQGRFRLGGLLARRYRLAALGPQLQWGAQSDPIEAGESGVTLIASSEALFPQLRGRVVDLRGQPVSAVSIVPWSSAFSAEIQRGGRTSHISRFFVAPAVRTDEQGAFEMRDVLRQHLNFMVEGDSITPAYASVDTVRDPLSLEIRVAARARLELVASRGVVTALRALDDSGAVVDLLELRADGYSNYPRFELTAGRSGVLSVGAQARVLELWCGTELRERLPLDLRAGELVTITR